MKRILFIAFLLLSLVSNALAQVPSYVPTSGLVGWWPFNGNANDESGNGNNGTVNGATLTSDRNGNSNSAYSFNGSSSIVVPTPTFTFPENQDFTVSAFAYITSQSVSDPIVGYGDLVPNNYVWYLGEVYPRLQYGVAKQQSFWSYASINSSNAFPNSNNWYHLLGVKKNGVLKLFVNDQLVDSAIQAMQGALATNLPLTFGWFTGTAQYMNGKIDEIGIWNRALTQQEVLNLYQGAQPCPTVAAIQGPNTVNVGNNITLTDTTSNGQWLVSDTSVASIDTNGVLLGISPGNLIVYYVLNTPCGPDSSFYSITVTSNSGNTCLPSYVPLNGLVGWWPFCGNANDESGHGHNGVTHSVSLQTDRFGNINHAYNFGNLKWISVPYDSTLACKNALSISVWVKPYNIATTPFSAVLQKSNSNFQGFGDYNMNIISQGPRLGYTTNSFSALPFNCNDPIQDSQWINIVSTWNGSNQKIYVNNVLKYSSQFTGILNDGHLELDFGANFDGADEYFEGDIDDIGIWNRALDSAEVSNLYNATSTGIQGLTNSHLVLFPNPATNEITISNPSAPQVYTILSINGQLLKSGNLIKGTQTIDVADFSNGIYLLKTTTATYKFSVVH